METSNRKPTHVGEIIKHDYLLPLKMDIDELAESLNISHQQLVDVLNGKSGISIDVAEGLARTFNTTPDLWMNLQLKCDLEEMGTRK